MTQKKNNILETALLLFSQKGYSNTPTSLIAKEAGVSEGLIFRHFTNKEGLLKAILEQGISQIEESLTVLDGQGKPQDEMLRFVEMTFSIIEANKGFWKLMTAIRTQPEAKQMINTEFGYVYQNILQKLTACMNRQKLPNPEAQALYYFALIDGIAVHYEFFGENYPLESVTDVLKNQIKITFK